MTNTKSSYTFISLTPLSIAAYKLRVQAVYSATFLVQLKLMLKMHGPIWMGNSMFPMSSFLVPSKAQTTKWVFCIWERSIGRLYSVAIGITFTDDPLSSRALGNVYLLQLIVMYKSFILSRPLNEDFLISKGYYIAYGNVTHELVYLFHRYIMGDKSLT